MSAQQLPLLAPAKPLLERFGADFFRTIPPRPGVYIMGDHSDRVLYIGQSKNLRHRLGSYKNARPNHAPRKVIRLVHQVRTIVWEECPTAAAARVKENELLRVHRPKFNVVNLWPKANGFIAVMAEPTRLTLHLTNEPRGSGRLYGAFKNGYARAAAALLRLLWSAAHQPDSIFDLPAPLLREKPPREYSLDLLDTTPWTNLLEKFFTGESSELIEELTRAIPSTETRGTFQKNFHANDLEILIYFFERGPKRNRDLRQRHAITDAIITQEELDDLLALEQPPRRPRNANPPALAPTL